VLFQHLGICNIMHTDTVVKIFLKETPEIRIEMPANAIIGNGVTSAAATLPRGTSYGIPSTQPRVRCTTSIADCNRTWSSEPLVQAVGEEKEGGGDEGDGGDQGGDDQGRGPEVGRGGAEASTSGFRKGTRGQEAWAAGLQGRPDGLAVGDGRHGCHSGFGSGSLRRGW
jgi:hypothetical protein